MASFDRRTLITGALATAALPGLALAGPVPADSNLHFAIFRNGKPFGQYNVQFATSGDLLTVTTDVSMSMKVAKMNVFDYQHHCVETWRGGRFVSMSANSIRDRQRDQTKFVAAERRDFGVRITTNAGPLDAPVNAAPLTHWNQAVLQGPIFNPEDGLMLTLTATPLGREQVLLANGQRINATHWALRGKQQIDEWYDDAGLWVALRAVFPDKSIIEYRRV